ncbi:hypothetical protein KFL_000150020 [Klebsormidium nitens]|uniref:Thioredoxin domain-containing protein n=1 Tax=Klebsormidium nitens TaxID=105231 RepID=A0A1Y1HNI7_KLENI|nr:hypothetical protein KFL_000150020 [Klebsormidium nitens]|eukprot:GAQ78551.1 hypothetical protein KFL_000150020 [Klebsormidium nitens]
MGTASRQLLPLRTLTKAFDITTAASAPRKVLNGGSDGLLASAANQAVSALTDAMEAIESLLNISAPDLRASDVKELSGLDNYKQVLSTEKKVVVLFTGCDEGCGYIDSVFEGMCNHYAGRGMAFYNVDAYAERDIVSFANVVHVPMVIVYKNGDRYGSAIGDNLLEDLEVLLERLV